MKIYFTRHGESEANVQKVFWNQPEEYGLTEIGREQARTLAGSLANIVFTALYCSPVLRAVQTAEIVGKRLHLVPVVAEALQEWDVGIIEGEGYNQETQGLHWYVTSQWLKHGNYEARIEGGESFNDIASRFLPFIDELRKSYDCTDVNLLLVSHGGTLSCMLPLICSNISNEFSLSQGLSYAKPVVTELRDGEWVCLRWGEEILTPPF
jgi:probable phosphoglycerate mutase